MNKVNAVSNYAVPQVEIIEMEVEQCFATSGEGNTEGFGDYQ